MIPATDLGNPGWKARLSSYPLWPRSRVLGSVHGTHSPLPDWVLLSWPVAQCFFIFESSMGHVSGKPGLTYNRYTLGHWVCPCSLGCTPTVVHLIPIILLRPFEPPTMVTSISVLMNGGTRVAVVLGLPLPWGPDIKGSPCLQASSRKHPLCLNPGLVWRYSWEESLVSYSQMTLKNPGSKWLLISYQLKLFSLRKDRCQADKRHCKCTFLQGYRFPRQETGWEHGVIPCNKDEERGVGGHGG